MKKRILILIAVFCSNLVFATTNQSEKTDTVSLKELRVIELKMDKNQGDTSGLSQFYGGIIAILATATGVVLTNWLSEKSRKRMAREKILENEEKSKIWLGKYFYFIEPLSNQIESLDRFLKENRELPYSLSTISRNKSLQSASLNSQEFSIVINYVHKSLKNKFSKNDCNRWVYKFESQVEVIKDVATSLLDDFSYFVARQKELNENFNESINSAALILYHLEKVEIDYLKNENDTDLYTPLLELWNVSIRMKMVKDADLFELQESFIFPFLQITQQIQDSVLKKKIEDDILKCNRIIGTMRSNHERWYKLVLKRKQNFEISLKAMESQLEVFGEIL